jgi:thiamine kinase-like enzyme
MFYPVIEDPQSLLAEYDLGEITSIDRRSPTDWTNIYFANDVNERKYAIRLTNTTTTSSQERILEHAIAVKLSDHGIGPRIYASFPDEGVLLMDRLQPVVFDSRNRLQIEQLAKMISELHSIDISELPDVPVVAVKYSNAKATLDTLFSKTNRFPQHEEAFDAWWKLKDKLEGKVLTPVLCHNDIHARNLLMLSTGSLALIDNDHTSLGSGLYDLAAAAISFKLPADVEEFFMQSYGAQVPYATFLEYKKLVYLTYACMVFSFIENHQQIDTNRMINIDPSGGFGMLPKNISRDNRLFIQSCRFLQLSY